MNTSKNLFRQYFSLFLGTGLVAGNLLQMAAPVFAGALTITNEATGTYDDGNGNSNTTISNKVEIQVTEVPGIRIDNKTISKADNSGNAVTGQVQPGDKVVATFDVVSTGNDPTKFFIPGVTELNANSAITNGTATKVIYQVKDANGNNVGTAVELTAAGQNIASSVPTGGKVEVTVLVDVSSSAQPSDNVEVRLGNTPTVPGTNLDRTVDIDADDVYTVDNLDSENVPGEYPGAATTIKEASNKQSIGINAIPKPFVKIDKTYGTYSDNNTTTIADDTLEYNLAVTIPSTKPAGASTQVTTDNLYPTYVNGLSGSGVTGQLHVLISDALPTGTKLESFISSTPSGWTAVYSEDTNFNQPAYKAEWKLQGSVTNINNVTRVGYVYTGGQSVAKSDTPITGFNFKIKLTSINAGDAVLNLAQVFGEESGKTPTSTTNPSVYDESGDNTYNNDTNLDGVADSNVDTTDGVADPNEVRDTGNDNNGTDENNDANGEPNVFIVPLKGILNGTVIDNVNFPGATGAGGDNNTDFSNGAAAVTASDVPEVTFENSVKNTSNSIRDLKIIILASDLTDLPVGTTTIKVADPNDATKTVTYTAVQATAGGTPTLTDDKLGVPLTFTNVAVNGEARYEVKIDLPNDAGKNAGYDVPVTAFIGTGNTPAADAPKNVTTDRVYTGFITLLKESRILDATGTPVSGANGQFGTGSKTANTGERIEFRITYTNISEAEPSGGSDNVVLNANNFKIIEDGANATNNWAGVTGHIQSTSVNSAAAKFDINFFNGGTGLGTTDPATDATVTKYESGLKSGEFIAPQETGSFQFQRSIK
jgi:hypothetical protein